MKKLKLSVFAAILSLISLNTVCAQDETTFVKKMAMIANQGNSEAQYYMGMMYNHGQGVTKDLNKAFGWFKKSAISKDPLGSYKVGCFYAGQYQGVAEVDLNKMLEYKLLAADAGYDLAQHDIAIEHYRRKEFKNAAKWWKQASLQGYPMAHYNLSVLYREGKGVEKDSVSAYVHFKLAKLLSEKKITASSQVGLNEIANDLTEPELRGANVTVSQWKSQPSQITIKARQGMQAAVTFIKKKKIL